MLVVGDESSTKIHFSGKKTMAAVVGFEGEQKCEICEWLGTRWLEFLSSLCCTILYRALPSIFVCYSWYYVVKEEGVGCRHFINSSAGGFARITLGRTTKN